MFLRTILGPLLFIIYINDVTDIINDEQVWSRQFLMKDNIIPIKTFSDILKSNKGNISIISNSISSISTKIHGI